jgi:hypothetical protein
MEKISQSRPVVVTIIGEGGVGKSSLSCSAEGVLYFGCDHSGWDRMVGDIQLSLRNPYEYVDRFAEIRDIDFKSLKGYQTVVLDGLTRLTDLIIEYIYEKQPNLKYAKDQRRVWGEVGKEIKMFIASIMSSKLDVVLVDHSKPAGEDGVAKELLMQGQTGKILVSNLSDIVGFIDSNRTLSFNRVFCSLCKNSPSIEDQIVDVVKDKRQLAKIIEQTKKSMLDKRLALNAKKTIIIELETKIATCENVDYCNILLGEIQGWKEKDIATSKVLFELLRNRAKELGFEYNQTEKQFVNNNKNIVNDSINI